MPRLLVASNNAGKIREFRALLAGCGWQIVAPRDIGLDLAVEEDGQTYAENARRKARAFAAASGLPALADDSGLEVEALGGQPGPLHHVKGWDGASDAEKVALLMQALKDIPPEGRTARYKVVLVLALPDGDTLEFAGACEGVVIDQPAGSGGFGYDPVFYLPAPGRTMAELSFEEKNQLSHRAQAAQAARPRLKQLAAVRRQQE